MEPVIEAIISTILVSAFMAAIFYILYLTAVKGFESPLRLYHRFKARYSEHSQNKRVKEKMKEYRTFSGVGSRSFLRSAVPFSLFILVILILLFKLVFFTAIVSNSMQPTFKRGDLVLMQKIAPMPEEGDIIMFERREVMLPITHRVIAVTDEGVKTKGDARGTADPWIVQEEAIMAKAVQLEEEPIVVKDVGNYFILDTGKMGYNPKYGSEYLFVKNIFLMLRLYGYVVCIVSIMGYLILTLVEAKKRQNV
ncbi:MAG TPA: signal peptidase I [Methanophagales archaeon]|nr:signal peptidase I [Methanophagales archaeon]